MKHFYFFSALLLFSTLSASAHASIPADTTQVFTYAEKMPSFPGGDSLMFAFVNNNIKYPAKAKADGVSGTVYTRFTVTRSGKIKDAEIVKSLHPELDKEVLRVVSLMPTWAPGEQAGQKVHVKYVMPVKFRIQKTDTVYYSKEDSLYRSTGFFSADKVNKSAAYNGGVSALESYITQNLIYPTAAQQQGVQGTVWVNFKVEESGKVTNVHIMKSVREDLDLEAKRLVAAMPALIAAEHNGKKVPVNLTLPVRFTIEGAGTENNDSVAGQPKELIYATDPEDPNNKIFISTQKPPQYPGGESKMYDFLNLRMGAKVMSGYIVVLMIVRKDGSLSNFKTIDSVGPAFEMEFMTTLRYMPKWEPAEVNGEKVDCYYELQYRLNSPLGEGVYRLRKTPRR